MSKGQIVLPLIHFGQPFGIISILNLRARAEFQDFFELHFCFFVPAQVHVKIANIIHEKSYPIMFLAIYGTCRRCHC